ncbi:ATP-dependent metallopeptidase Hfl [Coniophora puteana RWD-64-598 SS2]|uniref:ATP-dependent metallopeptidase Hfl n=1 Tax=Coniophora puteana (strain RWD-64-598) TaxID=741705 RepID=A0A5M3N1B8_CONPW|nr:ATP-dependent metallopeptidase Hfl [Coniophora puteana RWD-64-598 SS2]EIW85192.1 ATP-dependent metallopeptidase Hfl [Coniophora puteana RWD-64-598 SS2]
MSKMEADANANPNDIDKQLALFQALVDTNVKAGRDIVISRWERMCQFDPNSPLLKSDKAFELYLTSLIQNGMQSSVDPAVRRRESLLAAQVGAATTDPAPATSASALDSVAPATPSESAPASSPASSTAYSASAPLPPPSSPSESPAAATSASQAIAQRVLSNNASASASPAAQAAGASSSANPDMAKLAASLGAGSGVSGNPIHVTLSEPKGSLVMRLVRFFTFTALSAFFVLIVLSVLMENSGMLKSVPRKTEYEPNQQKTVRFSDVHGVDEVKEELKDIVQFLKDPASFASLGGRLPKGVLLTGPPGTGKTMLARAVAGEAGVPFFFASGSEFEEMFVGVGAKRVRELFATARKREPAIIFIDELDAVGGKRSQREQHYMKQTLNQLLVEMDGFLQSEGVIVIAATNFPESLDPALTRPGRFDRHVAVPLPDIRGRVQLLQHFMKEIVTGSAVDPMILARGTPGFSGAELENMVNQAAIQASKEGSREVALNHFEWAKDRILLGAERKTAFITEDAKLLTAYHEGGHVLAALYTEGAMPLHKVTCVPRGHALGVTSQLPENDRFSVTQTEYKATLDVCMGGRVAEGLIYGVGGMTSGASSDLQKATSTATAMVKQWGFSEKVGPVFYPERDESISPATRELIDGEIIKLLSDSETRVAKLLAERKDELHRLARALVEHETLTADEVRKVIQGEPIRDIKEKLAEEPTAQSQSQPQASLQSTVQTPTAPSSSSPAAESQSDS